MKRLMGVPLVLFLLIFPASSQDKVASAPPTPPQVLVTFYSTGSFWKAAMPGYKFGAFSGLIFDDNRQLAQIRPGHFVTFKLNPGSHVFSANYWLNGHPKGGAHLKRNLDANQHYYIGTYFKTTPLLVLSTPRIEEADCNDAQKDAASATPLAREHIKDDALTFAISETSFPQCRQ
jgi:hypothetical protein